MNPFSPFSPPIGLPRRAALALGAAALAPSFPARAAPAVPCPSGPGDIVGLILEGTGAPAGTVVVIGHAFRPGDLPRGAGIRARGPDGREVPAQLDVISTHTDGSTRLGVLSLAPPAIGRGQERGFMLMAGGGAAGAPLDPAAALSGRSAVLELEAPGSTPWRVDLLTAFRATGPGAIWQSGSLAVQRRLTLPVPPASVGGVTSLRLVADVALRSDGTLWVDAWLRNDVAMRPGGGTASYAARLLLDGREALRTGRIRHWQYTGWGRLLAVDNGRPVAEPPRARHDVNYLADAGAVPRYNTGTGVPSSVLGQVTGLAADPNWSAPLGTRGVRQDMPATGGRADIGPATQPQAVWLMTGDHRAAIVSMGQAEASGSVPWHMWDASTDGWLDVKKWPRLWTDARGGSPPTGLMQQISNESGWQLDSAHQPDLATVPFVLTGRRAFLDELLAQSAWNVIGQWPDPRGNGDANLVRGTQVRGAAWSLRQIDNAAWAAPARDGTGDYLRAVAAGNWAWVRAQIPEWTRRQGESHGWIPGEYGTPGAMPPWQQDYFASTAAHAARRGSADARAVLDWMENFLAGRFLSGNRGFSPNDGCAYLIAISPENTPQSPYSTWAAIGEATRARNLSNGNGWSKSGGDYGQLALQTLSLLVEVTGTQRARAAYSWFVNAGAPFTAPAQRAGSQFDIVPREAAETCRPSRSRASR